MQTSRLLSAVNFRRTFANGVRSPTQRSAEPIDSLVNGRVVDDDIRTTDDAGRHEVYWIWSRLEVSEELLSVPCRLPLWERIDSNVSEDLDDDWCPRHIQCHISVGKPLRPG